MLKELLKKANICQAELVEKKAEYESCGHELYEARCRLEEINGKQSERLSAEFSMRVHHLYEEIKELTDTQAALSVSIADLALDLELAKNNALEFIDKYGVALSDAALAEDDIVYEVGISYDENRILTELLSSQEGLFRAQGKLDAARAKVAEPERDEQVIRVRTAYYNAAHTLEDFNVRAPAASGAYAQAFAGERLLLTDRLNMAKEECERLLSEYGVLHLFSELEFARADYEAAKTRFDKAKSESDMLPLTAPVGRYEKGKGAVTLELIARAAAQPAKTVPDYEPARPSGALSGAEKEIRARRETEIRKREAQSELDRLTAGLRSARSETEALKREAAKAKSEVEMIKRAKALAVLNIKRSLLAAERSALAAKAAERELARERLSKQAARPDKKGE